MARDDCVAHPERARTRTALPEEPAGGVGRRRSRGRRALASVGLVLALLAAASALYAWHLNAQITRLAVPGLASDASGMAKGTQNILLVGSTSRCALTVQKPAYGLCSQGVTGVNSDVVMVLHLDAAKHAVSVLSIPRDTFVPNARTGGANKIDAALAEGPGQLVQAIQQDFGIPIQHYIQLNFETFAGVVDAVGGVRMSFPEPVFDAFSGLDIRTAGCRHLDGEQTLQVVRARHLQYRPAGVSDDHASWPQETESDLARIRRNHEFLRVLARTVARQGLGNPVTDQRLIAAVAPKLEVDNGLSARDLTNLVLGFHDVNIDSAPQLTLPVVTPELGSYRYKGADYGDIVWPSQPEDNDVIHRFLGLAANTDTETGAPLPAPAAVTVSVLNGTGASNAATDTASRLAMLGFPILQTGDTPSVAKQSETVIYYAAPADAGAAQVVLQHLSGFAVLGVNPTMMRGGARVTVVTGSRFSVRTSAAPTTAATSAPTTGTEGPGPADRASVLTPTPPEQPLAEWDPRSCP